MMGWTEQRTVTRRGVTGRAPPIRATTCARSGGKRWFSRLIRAIWARSGYATRDVHDARAPDQFVHCRIQTCKVAMQLPLRSQRQRSRLSGDDCSPPTLPWGVTYAQDELNASGER
jgi:hypothetical protein